MSLLCGLVCCLPLPSACAQAVLQAPIGGKPIPLGDGWIACAASAGGWTVDASGRSVRPPAEVEAIGSSTDLAVATSSDACAGSAKRVTLLATSRWPAFDSSSIVFSPDEGRLEARGRNLNGVTITWQGPSGSGVDVCHEEKTDDGAASCTWAIGTTTATGVGFAWFAAGARSGADVLSFDAEGEPAGPGAFALTPARIVLRRLVPLDASVDLTTGQGVVPLVHPDAVASADCGALACELESGKLVVRGTSSLLSSLELRLRLRPHVFLVIKDTADPQPTVRLPLTYCPMSIVSGAPIRANDHASLVVKLDGVCANDVSSLAFQSDHSLLKVRKVFQTGTVKYVWLQLGNIDDDNVTITALRGENTRIALAVARSALRAAPRVRSSLELPDFPNLGFVPTNRRALVHVSPLSEHEHLVLLPIEGVYTVSMDHGAAKIQGDSNAAGVTELRFGIRNDSSAPAFRSAMSGRTFENACVCVEMPRRLHARRSDCRT